MCEGPLRAVPLEQPKSDKRRAQQSTEEWAVSGARIQMRHQNESDIAVRRHAREELFEGFEAASRRADSTMQKGGSLTLVRRVF